MTEALFPYYERELLFLRQMAQEFARQYPTIAGRLLLEPNRSADPHVERVMESFALVAGRIHHKLDDEFPELTDPLLSVLCPHYLVTIPSLAVLQFRLDPAAAQLPNGFVIPRASPLHTQSLDGVPCKFRTSYPVHLWPLELSEARLQIPPFPAKLRVPPRTEALLRLQLDCLGGLSFADLSLEKLRFHLHGDPQVIPRLYELLFNHVIQVMFRPVEPDTQPAPVLLRPEECVSTVGFEPNEGLLPYPSGSPPGYRLLTELFTFPAKFLFLDLGGWKQVRRAGCRRLEVVLFLDRTFRRLDQGVSTSTFLLGCTPIVNLFAQSAEPIALTHAGQEYRVVPDQAHPDALEVYAVDAVAGLNTATGATAEYRPFYSFRHDWTPDEEQTFWYSVRRPALSEGDGGTDVYLRLVDRVFNPHLPAAGTMAVRTTCSNRNVAAQFQLGGLAFELEAAAPLAGIACVRPPTASLRPPARRGRVWRLVSHLNLNHLSLSDPREGLEALQEILRLYDLSDPGGGQQEMTAINQQMIEGIVSMATREVTTRLRGSTVAGGFCRSLEVTLEFDQDNYPGVGVFLFASVLERFLGQYTTWNSFCQLVGKVKQAEGHFKRWPARPGELPLV